MKEGNDRNREKGKNAKKVFDIFKDKIQGK